jgi:hypothetical protein
MNKSLEIKIWRTGYAVFLLNEVAKYRLLDDALIFTAEIFAIHQVTPRIQESTLQDFVIYSDSLSTQNLSLYRTTLSNPIWDLAVDKNIQSSQRSHQSTNAVRFQDENLRFEIKNESFVVKFHSPFYGRHCKVSRHSK